VTQDFSHPAGTLAAGDQIAGYQIGEQIGTGGMAVVYRALDLRLDRQVALKVLAPRLAEDDAFRQRFIRESRAAAGVDHPHIIPVFEAGEADGVLFIAMRYVSGGDVRSLIQAEGRLSTARASAIASQAAAALDTAHTHGLVHRDVKPGNILLDSAGGRDHVYLADFGLSKYAVGANTLTGTGQFMGTLDYVSPEQIQGHRADGRADQYALACTVVEMLCGKPPYTRDESMALLWAQLEAPPPKVTELRADLPAGLNQVIGTALAKSPDSRYPTCLDFAAALAQACAAQPVVLREPTELAAAVRAEPVTPPAARPGWAGQTRPEQMLPAIPAAEETAAAAPQQPAPHQPAPHQPAAAAAVAPPARDRMPGAAPGAGEAVGGPALGGPALGGPALGGPALGGPASDDAVLGGAAMDGLVGGGVAAAGLADRAGASIAADPTPTGTVAAGPAATPPRPAAGWGGQPAARDAPGPARPAGLVQPPAGTWSPAREPHLVPQRQQPRRGGRKTLAVLLGAAVVAGAGFAGFKLLDRPATNNLPPVRVTKTVAPPSTGTAAALGPEGTVRAYFAAINHKRYRLAWRLNTVVHNNQDFQQFVSGLSGTVRDTIQIQSTTGNVVTAQLLAHQTDGRVKTFQGTYTVTNGVISGSRVYLISTQ
jgi:Protein kinase domain